MQYQFRPLEPSYKTIKCDYKDSRFKSSWLTTIQDLERELKHLRAKNIILQADISESDIRRDGMLYSNAKVGRPLVVVSFDSKHGPLSYPCGKFRSWKDNVRAIALSLESLRKVDRFGVTKNAEQYKGWKSLPFEDSSKKIGLAKRIIQGYTTAWVDWNSSDMVSQSCRRALIQSHPDKGGSEEQFNIVQAAIKTIQGYVHA